MELKSEMSLSPAQNIRSTSLGLCSSSYQIPSQRNVNNSACHKEKTLQRKDGVTAS